MPTATLEKIAAIEAEAQQKIEALKREAVSEVVKRIAALKSELAELETEYAKLTGKNTRGEPVASTRRRLTNAEKAALVETVASIIQRAPNGVSFGEIARESGHSASAVRAAIREVKGIKTTGNKASTRYFLK